METKTVKAKKVRSDLAHGTGDFLVGLDNGYVYDISHGEYDVEITFHDADGGENTLTCGKNMLITVERR